MSACSKLIGLAALCAVASVLPTRRTTAQEVARPAPVTPTMAPALPWGSDVFVPLPKEPSIFKTSDYIIRVVTVADGLERPWSIAFLPDGDMLVTERAGRLRIIRKGVLDPKPIAGMPTDIQYGPRDGLMDLALHPNFAQNHFVYFTYTKRGDGKLAANENPACKSGLERTCVGRGFAGGDATSAQAITLARGRLDGHALTDVRDLLIAEKWAASFQRPSLGSRIMFGRDGMLYMSVAGRTSDWNLSQTTDTHLGKVLRLRDDGTASPDNPFASTPGAKPEIFTLGHRNILGLAVHPETGALWAAEMGPQGGDEINILISGKNYGWPKVSMGRDYSGEPYPYHASMPGFEGPTVFWAPAIGISGLSFYTGDRFPKWKDSVFVGSQSLAHLQRVVFNKRGQHVRREWLLLDLKQRIRDVRQGPDGYLYVLTDARQGAVLRIEPVE